MIERNGGRTQRSIAKTLNISLGNAKVMVKGLVESNYLKVRESSKNRVQYLMPQKGDSEKVLLAHEYLNFLLTFCCDTEARIKRTFNKLCRQNKHSVVFYGAGKLAELAFHLLQQTPIELRAVVDANLAGQPNSSIGKR